MEEVLTQIMELGVEIGKLKGESTTLKNENKRLREINDQLTASLEKLAMGVNMKEQIEKEVSKKFGEGYQRQNNE